MKPAAATPGKPDKSPQELAAIEAEERQAVEIFARRLDQAVASKSSACTLTNPLTRN